MAEHRIHLRRAWEGPCGRIDLPTTWDQRDVPDELRRNFHRPSVDDPEEVICLIVEDSTGLVAVSLNGEDLGFPPGTDLMWEIAIQTRIRSSNRLILRLDPAKVSRETEWGRICLAIRS